MKLQLANKRLDPFCSQTPLEFIGFFVVLWFAVFFFLATLGGWRRLAEAYRLNGPFEGERWHFRSARMRWGVNYKNCLTMGANRSGVYLAVLLPFRLAHPPLFIPWSEIGASERKGLVFKYLDFSFQQAPGVRLRVRDTLGSALLRAGGREQKGSSL